MKDLNILLNFLKNKSFNQIKEELSQKPYCLSFDETEDLYLLKYNQIDSDMSNDLVQLCRGIILEKNTNKPICIPFYKFFNYGESLADSIDWNSCRVQEKIDGSIIKLFWYKDDWKVATNGTINSFGNKIKDFDFSFGDLFVRSFIHPIRFLNSLNRDNTYMFELVSPFTKIVVNYPETKIYHIGTRNNITFEELNIDIGIEKPKEYKLKSLPDCIKTASIMKEDEEGYVIVDSNYNRIKVKSPFYVQLHHTINNGQVTKERLILMLRNSSLDDFLSIFPEYKIEVNKIVNKLNDLYCNIIAFYRNYFNEDSKDCKVTRKELAFILNKVVYSNILFALYDKKFDISNLSKYVLFQKMSWLEKILGE
jgi:hypothetical protein